MRHHALLLLALLPLSACASPTKEEVWRPIPIDAYNYKVSIASVPAGVSNLVLTVRLPGEWPSSVLRPGDISGLVGNAPFILPFMGGFVSGNSLAGAHGDSGYSMPSGPAQCGWLAKEENGIRHLELRVETKAKPMEIALHLEQLPGATPIEASALEKALVAGTSATADGQPIEALVTRLERVR